ncbi:MAG: phosphatase PAP2 family protein [Methylacidiphilales bacterium]|nr:phosphatase PAP2 family protein [Candidatus Methylacidiphilales bacterium]MDW8349390.1 phosphatase PAP2 family protein [Verrucomicrobiae bacterium]
MLIQADETLFYAINHTHHPILDWFMVTLSNAELFYPFILIAIIFLIIKGKKKERHFLALLILTILTLDRGIIWTLKPLVNRPRPHETLPHVRKITIDLPRIHLTQKKSIALPLPLPHYIRIDFSPSDQHLKPPPPKGRSFISGHAANNAALAMLSAQFYPHLAPFFFLIALFVSYSRIYVGSHYPSDILIAWVLAGAVTTILGYAYKRITKQA